MTTGQSLKSILRQTAAFGRDREGGAAIVMGLMSPVVFFGIAFATEAATWELTKRRLQSAADVAAFAAGTQLRSGYDEDAMLTAAKIVASESGYKGGDEGIVVQSPPQTAPNIVDPLNSSATISPNGENGYVHVILTETVDRTFSRLFTAGGPFTQQTGAKPDVVVRTQAIAQIRSGRPACVLALHPSADSAIDVSGSTNVTLSGCDVAANSISNQAITTQGSSAQLAADCVTTVGGVNFHTDNNVSMTCANALENSFVTPDPYRDRPEPDFAALGCSNNNDWTKNNGQPSTGARYCATGNVTINNDVTIDHNGFDDWVVLDGGSWKFNASSVFNGSGVTLFLTNGATLDINGGATFNLKAPTSGDYSGLAVYMDRSDTGSHKFNGGAGFAIVGAIYGANSEIELSGNVSGSGPGECTQIITGKVTFTGSSAFNTDCSNSGTTAIVTGAAISIVG